MMNKQRNILVTIALFYANGPIHLGHLVEAIQADIWVRWQRMQNNRCLFLSGSDAHGTSIMISAERQNISPESLIQHMNVEHFQDFQKFFIDFDYFYTTHSEENQELTNLIYQRLQENGDIEVKKISQAFDPEKKIFLADRFIKGECPRCGAKDQYGDNCEICGSTYDPSELKNPVSIFSGAKPILKESEHYFFKLEKHHQFLNEWINSGHLPAAVANKMQEWLKDPLKEWDISRDQPYFGFEIPNAPGKYFYVWLEAPIGYIACLKKLSKERTDVKFEEYWQPDTTSELYHFIGKDIVYFHTLFWPAMLHSANLRLPTNIFVHGFLTINGQKMSKSRGTFITAAEYLQQLDPEFLRYYLAAKLSAQIEDIDLNFADLATRINADLVGKFVNLASRCAGFIAQQGGRLASTLPHPQLFDEFTSARKIIGESFESRQYSRAVREIMSLADRANQYIDQQKPWQLVKESNQAEALAVCTQGINLFKVIATYLQPILPETSKKIISFLKIDALNWQTITEPLLNHQIADFKPLIQRIKIEDIEILLKQSGHGPDGE